MARTITTKQNYQTEVRSGSSSSAVQVAEWSGAEGIDKPAEFERFEKLARAVATVPKSEVNKKRQAP